uniref:Uncharacterized protein n=1 Tax=Panagrolaimus sp. JU765 TaxID=591449 RepID=A0AC34QLB0_9BILA
MKSSLSQKSKNGAKKDADRSAKMSSAHARGAIQNSIDESLEKSAVDEGLNVVVVENEGEHVSDVESDAEEAGSEEREADDEEEIFDGFNFLNTYEGRPVNNGEDDSAPRYYSSQVFEPDSEAEKGEQGNNLGESRGTAQPAANGTPRVVSQEAVQASATGTDCPRTAGNGGSAVAGNPVASAPPRAPLPVNPNCQGNVLQNGAKNATCTVSTPLIQNVNASAPTNSQRQSQQPVLNTQTTRAVVASCPGDRPGMPNLPASANMPVANESYMNTPPVNTQNANQNLETVAAAPIPEPAGPNPSEILFIENFLFRFPADKAESVNKTLRWWIEKVPKANIIEKILKLNWDNISTNCQQFERFIEKLQKKVENKIVFVDGGADDGAEDEQQGGNMPSQGGTQTSGSSLQQFAQTLNTFQVEAVHNLVRISVQMDHIQDITDRRTIILE